MARLRHRPLGSRPGRLLGLVVAVLLLGGTVAAGAPSDLTPAHAGKHLSAVAGPLAHARGKATADTGAALALTPFGVPLLLTLLCLGSVSLAASRPIEHRRSPDLVSRGPPRLDG